MDDDVLYGLAYDGLSHFYRFLERASPEARLVERDGIVSAMMPATPERSFNNAVLYRRDAALAAALPELERAYEEAGVRAWTVWVHGGDGESAAMLERAGHVLDASPVAMAFELEQLDAEPSPAADIDPRAKIGDVGRINDAAYGHQGGDFAQMLRERPDGDYTLYVARLDGEPRACAGAFDHGDNCDITLVATLPEARGRGLATELVKRALVDARGRGRSTTTLVATKMGKPIYERLGYRALRGLEMWERRR